MFNMLFQAQAKYRSCGYLQHTFKLFVACKSFPKVISNVLYMLSRIQSYLILQNCIMIFSREFIILSFLFLQIDLYNVLNHLKYLVANLSIAIQTTAST